MPKDNVIILENDEFITAIFRNPPDAEVSYRHLLDIGYNKENINLIMSDTVRKQNFSNSQENEFHDMGNKSVEGLGIGAVAGGTIGGIAAAIAALGTALVFPVLGLTISGPLAAGLAGAGAGSTTGGLIGALVGWGFPSEKAKILEEEVKNGGVAIVIKMDSEVTRALLLKNISTSSFQTENLSD